MMSATVIAVQVAAQEIAKGPTPDRMAAIASHIIGQRRWGSIVTLVCPCNLCSHRVQTPVQTLLGFLAHQQVQ